MPCLNAVVNHEVYQTYYKRICECETDRVFCCHQMNHLLDVARIAYIKNLEEGLGFDKELICMAAVLHDIGKSFQYRQQIPHEIAGERIARRILILFRLVLHLRMKKSTDLSGSQGTPQTA